MVTIKSFIKANDTLVPIEEFTGPILDEDYIEGAIEMSIDGQPVLTREMIDYVDQLWAYLARGIGEVVAGHEFSTNYPDMPLKIVLQPQGEHVKVLIRSRSGKRDTDVSTSLDELLRAMTIEGKVFFETLRSYAPSNLGAYDLSIADLAAAGQAREKA
jgi:hypothetical protein